MIPKKVGNFHNVAIYEASWMGSGHSSAGITLPGYGIIVGSGVYSEEKDLQLVMHEYGHILQYRLIGWWRFYLIVGISSLLSAWTNGYKKGHQNHWTESWCNHLSRAYFVNYRWPIWHYPPKDISPSTKRGLGIRK